MAQWLWSTILRHEIKDVQTKFNNSPIRWDKKKLLPSGKGVTPDHIYKFLEQYGLSDQLLKVDTTVVKELKDALGGESLLDFVSPEFHEIASSAYVRIGSPNVSSQNAWCVFKLLLPEVRKTVPLDVHYNLF